MSGVGTVQAFNTTIVRTQVSGRLIDVPYKEGQDVKEGDVLAVVDPALYQAAYDQAVAQKAKDEALLANSRQDEKRYSDLVKTNAATQQQADTAKWTVLQNEAQVKLDQALIDNAKANLQWATIKGSDQRQDGHQARRQGQSRQRDGCHRHCGHNPATAHRCRLHAAGKHGCGCS